eukprot:3217236-Ditylum_brightwellii.AAC.1
MESLSNTKCLRHDRRRDSMRVVASQLALLLQQETEGAQPALQYIPVPQVHFLTSAPALTLGATK